MRFRIHPRLEVKIRVDKWIQRWENERKTAARYRDGGGGARSQATAAWARASGASEGSSGLLQGTRSSGPRRRRRSRSLQCQSSGQRRRSQEAAAPKRGLGLRGVGKLSGLLQGARDKGAVGRDGARRSRPRSHRISGQRRRRRSKEAAAPQRGLGPRVVGNGKRSRPEGEGISPELGRTTARGNERGATSAGTNLNATEIDGKKFTGPRRCRRLTNVQPV